MKSIETAGSIALAIANLPGMAAAVAALSPLAIATHSSREALIDRYNSHPHEGFNRLGVDTEKSGDKGGHSGESGGGWFGHSDEEISRVASAVDEAFRTL